MRANSFFASWQNRLAVLLILAFVGIAAAAPLLAPPVDPGDPAQFKVVGKSKRRVPLPPGAQAVLGTTPGQHDIFYTIVWGTRPALKFGLLVTLFTAGIGTLIGAAAAYFGGGINQLLMRITDGFLCFPLIAGIVLFQQLRGLSQEGSEYGLLSYAYQVANRAPTFFEWTLSKIDPIMLAFIVFSWMPYARIINSMVLTIKEKEFLQAAIALGAGPLRVIFVHIIPNAIYPSIVLAARDVGGMVILQSTIAFIGLGGDSSWGILLAENRDWIIGPGGNILVYWWVFLPATLVIVLFGVGWNLFGGTVLNDWLNIRGKAH